MCDHLGAAFDAFLGQPQHAAFTSAPQCRVSAATTSRRRVGPRSALPIWGLAGDVSPVTGAQAACLPSAQSRVRCPDESLRMTTGIVMSGGGARGSYEVGVLNYLYGEFSQHFGRHSRTSMSISGTSVGAVNGTALAATANDPTAGMRLLANVWLEQALADVMRLDLRHVPRLYRLWLGGGMPAGLFDSRPRARLIGYRIPWRQLCPQPPHPESPSAHRQCDQRPHRPLDPIRGPCTRHRVAARRRAHRRPRDARTAPTRARSPPRPCRWCFRPCVSETITSATAGFDSTPRPHQRFRWASIACS